MSKAKNSKQRLLWWLLMAAAVFLLIFGGVVAWRQYEANQQADETAARQQDGANNGHATGDNPSTKKPGQDEFKNYRVAADLPRYIFIPKIGVKAMVKQVGLTSGGAIDAPTNVHDTAWYNGSAKPGKPGAMLIDGHISAYTTGGVFYKLENLGLGDEIKIERGDGRTLRYKVAKTQTYPVDKIDMREVLAPVNPAKPGLNLITCTGNIIEGTTRFDERLVVFAEQQ